MDDEELVARDGDLLVVSYPEVKIPLATKYSSITVGGLIYTRRLVAGDTANVEYERIYAFLKRMAERDARDKVRAWTEELAAASRRPAAEPPPKPAAAEQLRPAAPAAPGAKPMPVRR